MIGIKAVRLEGTATLRQGDPAGQWLQAADLEAHDGQGFAEFTHDPTQALAFNTTHDAIDYYLRASATRPLRRDGRPNRPLTAFTVSFEELP